MLLNNSSIKEKIKEEIPKFLGTNHNEETHYQNLWDTAKAASRANS